jgi:hypothetical protein
MEWLLILFDTPHFNTTSCVFGSLIGEILLKQRLGRRVECAVGNFLAVARRQQVSYLRGQDLAQFHSVLIVAVELPDEAFDAGAVFVDGQELSALVGIEFTQKQEGKRGSVAWELLMGK